MSSLKEIRGEKPKVEPNKKAFRVVVIFFIVAFISLVTIYFLFHPSVVIGPSMEPTYHDGQIVATDVHFEKEDITYDTVIIYRAPDKRKLIKRVVGMPGDNVEVRTDGVYVNGTLRKDDFGAIEETSSPVLLKEDEYFVLGDNRNNSMDSRYYGPVKFKDITNIVR